MSSPAKVNTSTNPTMHSPSRRASGREPSTAAVVASSRRPAQPRCRSGDSKGRRADAWCRLGSFLTQERYEPVPAFDGPVGAVVDERRGEQRGQLVVVVAVDGVVVGPRPLTESRSRHGPGSGSSPVSLSLSASDVSSAASGTESAACSGSADSPVSPPSPSAIGSARSSSTASSVSVSESVAASDDASGVDCSPSDASVSRCRRPRCRPCRDALQPSRSGPRPAGPSARSQLRWRPVRPESPRYQRRRHRSSPSPSGVVPTPVRSFGQSEFEIGFSPLSTGPRERSRRWLRSVDSLTG